MLARAESLVDSNVVLKRIGRVRKCVATLETIRRTFAVYAIMKDHLDDFEKLIKAVLKLL